MSAAENQINEAFDRIKKAEIRFDVAKVDLPDNLKDEIKSMSNGTYSDRPKSQRDFEEYLEALRNRYTILKDKFSDKGEKFNRFLPKEIQNLPWNILKNGQSVYLQNIKEGHPEFATIQDIAPFSSQELYQNLAEKLKKQWNPTKYPEAEILSMYLNGQIYDDAEYFVLESNDKIQAIGNLEIQKDGNIWLRGLNSAPWNQGKYRTYKNSARAIIARMVSFCLETGNNTLKLATNKKAVLNFINP